MTAIVYSWQPGSNRWGLPAQLVGEALADIETRDGRVTPTVVVDNARPVDAPLHKAFDWNDETAAENWRLEQARHLIRAVAVRQIGDHSPPEPVRAFVSIITDDDDREYLSTVTVMGDAEKRARFIARALEEIETWRRRHEAFDELARIFEAIDAVKNKPRRRSARQSGHLVAAE